MSIHEIDPIKRNPETLHMQIAPSPDIFRGFGSIATKYNNGELDTESAHTNEREASESAKKLAEQGFVKQAPRLSEQLADTTRTNRFQYAPLEKGIWNTDPEEDVLVEMTEHEGLTYLDAFLRDTAHLLGSHEIIEGREIGVTLHGIRENLSFIGEKEYTEGATGLGAYWRHYLDLSPNNQICVITEIGKTGRRQSDTFLLERVLQTFTEQEREVYAGRIVRRLQDLEAEPDNAKVIYPDDWSISGAQIRNEHFMIMTDERYAEYWRYADSMEVNLLISPSHRIVHGLPVESALEDRRPLPVRAYFVAHDAPDTAETIRNHFAHVSGTHSSVDYDFEKEIAGAVEFLNAEQEIDGASDSKKWIMPPLTNIFRKYRRVPPETWIGTDGKIAGLPSHREQR